MRAVIESVPIRRLAVVRGERRGAQAGEAHELLAKHVVRGGIVGGYRSAQDAHRARAPRGGAARSALRARMRQGAPRQTPSSERQARSQHGREQIDAAGLVVARARRYRSHHEPSLHELLVRGAEVALEEARENFRHQARGPFDLEEIRRLDRLARRRRHRVGVRASKYTRRATLRRRA